MQPKRLARTRLREQRRALAASRDLAADGVAIAEAALALLDRLALPPGAVVLSYESVAAEPPTGPLNAALLAAGHRVLVPVTLPDLDLDWHDLGRPDLLGLGAPGLADLVLAPGLAVDRSGTRLGQGGGCYDRALPRRRPGVPVVVLLHPGELLAAGEEPLPRDAHDAGVDAVLTAEGYLEVA